MSIATLLPSINEVEFRDFMRHWPTGVAIVTTAGPSGPVGCTVNALMSLSVEPPLLVVSLGEESRTLQAIRRTDLFGISILAAAQRELSERFANCAREQRFTDLELRVEYGVPLLAGAAARLRRGGRRAHGQRDPRLDAALLRRAARRGRPDPALACRVRVERDRRAPAGAAARRARPPRRVPVRRPARRRRARPRRRRARRHRAEVAARPARDRLPLRPAGA